MKPSYLITIFFVVLLALLHTDIAWPIGGYYMPSILIVGLFLILSPFALRSFTLRGSLFVVGCGCVAALSIAFSDSTLGVALVRSLLQFVFALLLFSVLTEWAISRPQRDSLYVALCVFLIFISMGSVLEKNISPVRAISDSFRERVYSSGDRGFGFSIYEGAQRDDASYGGQRSCFFSPEPSIVATTGLVCGIALTSLSPGWLSVALALSANILIFYATRSPLGLLSVAGIIGSLYWWVPRRATALSLAALSAALIASPWIETDRLVERWNSMHSSNPEMSIYSRVYVPYVVMLPAVVRHYPVSGIGFGAKDVARRVAPPTLGGDSDEFTIGTNGFARVFIFMGLFFGAIFLGGFLWYARKLMGSAAFAFFCFFLVGQCIGSVEGARYWGYLALMLAAFKLNRSEEEAYPETVSPASLT